MSTNPGCSVFVGNLDERVTERVLYDILIQAGRLVDLYIPKDKETDKPKGFAFAEYETEEVADYAVRLFSGLVTLYNRTLRFAISGQDKPSPNSATVGTPNSNSALKSRINIPQYNGLDVSPNHRMFPTSGRFPENHLNYERVPPLFTGVLNQSNNGFQPHYGSNNNYDYRRASGAPWELSAHSRPIHYNSSTTTGFGRY